MLFKKLKIILLPILALLIFIIVSVFILNALISTPSVRHYLLSRLSASIGYELHAKDIELSFWKGVGINVSGLDAISLTGAENTLTVQGYVLCWIPSFILDCDGI